MTRHAPISRIYGMAEGPPPTGQEAEQRNAAARAEAWHRFGLLVIDPTEVGDDWLRQAMTNEGNKRYGHRRQGHGTR